MENEVKSHPRLVRSPPMVAGSLESNLTTRMAARGEVSWDEARAKLGRMVEREGLRANREERRRDKT